MKLSLGSCEIVGVFGPMASGKTYLIGQWLQTENRYVRFDVTGETCEDPRVEHFWQSPDYNGTLQMYDRITQSPYYFRIAYHPGEDLRDEFRKALMALWRRKEIFKLLVVDEFHEVCSVNETPKFVQTMLRYARHAHLGMIGASQRLADVHKLFTAGCRQVILFRSDDARDKDAVNDRWGRECMLAFSNLRPLIFDDTTKTTKQVPQCIVIPRGGKPSIYDFQTDEFISIAQNERRGQAAPPEDAEEISGEDSDSGTELESSGEEAGSVSE